MLSLGAGATCLMTALIESPSPSSELPSSPPLVASSWPFAFAEATNRASFGRPTGTKEGRCNGAAADDDPDDACSVETSSTAAETAASVPISTLGADGIGQGIGGGDANTLLPPRRCAALPLALKSAEADTDAAALALALAAAEAALGGSADSTGISSMRMCVSMPAASNVKRASPCERSCPVARELMWHCAETVAPSAEAPALLPRRASGGAAAVPANGGSGG